MAILFIFTYIFTLTSIQDQQLLKYLFTLQPVDDTIELHSDEIVSSQESSVNFISSQSSNYNSSQPSVSEYQPSSFDEEEEIDISDLDIEEQDPDIG